MNNIRKRTFEILDIGEKGDRLSRFMDIFLMSLISLNVLSVILETLPNLPPHYHSYFTAFEIFSVLIFTVEYLARVWSAVESTEDDYGHPFWGRIRYMLTPMAVIDLMVILPFYLTFFIQADLRFMRVMRLLRVFKLTRYSSSMALLLQVLKEESKAISAALFVLVMLIIVSSSLMYMAEHDAQPEAFSSIPASMWWAVVTLTTVGYGDVVPITTAGKVLAGLISVLSIGIVALPAGLLASGFNEALHRRRVRYEKVAEDVMKDGVITSEEQQLLKEAQLDLDIKPEEARHILETIRNRLLEKEVSITVEEIEKEVEGLEKEMGTVLRHKCPHCGKPVSLTDINHED